MRLRFVSVLAVCSTIAFVTGRSAGHEQSTSTVTTLLHVSLADSFTPGRDVLVDLVEIPPNTSLNRHWHPGEEFHYYLEGEPEIQIGDGDVLRPAPGTVGHVPFEAMHRAGAGEAGAKILVFRVHTTGAPWRYLEGEEASEGRDAVRR